MPDASAPETKIDSLPFGLSPEQLPELVITFRVASTRIRGGFDEIIIRGDGGVLLRTGVIPGDPPIELPGRVEPLVVQRLLRLLQAEGIEGWDDVYPAETANFVAKVLTVALKEETKKEVSVCRTEFPEFSRAYGAVKLAAALARPEVLSNNFFQRI